MAKAPTKIDTHFCPYIEAPRRSYLISIIFGSALLSLVSGLYVLANSMDWV